jgi:hypothetical protein
LVKSNRVRKIVSSKFKELRLADKKSIDSLPPIFNNITNRGVHNLSKTILTDSQILVLSLGLNFIFTPQNRTDKDIWVSYAKFVRKLRIAKFFSTPMRYCKTSKYRVRSISFVSPSAGKHLEAYL